MSRSALFFPILALAAAFQQPALAAEQIVRTPAAATKANETEKLRAAIFAGGCFWGVEAVFSHVPGVVSAVSGYHGGKSTDASYNLVSGGKTNHAEAVRVTYAPAKVRYDQLLRIFFSVITDPTQLNRQGPDVGKQYRSALVPLSKEQGRVATAYLAQLRAADLWDGPVVTRIEKYRGFFKAEEYHQDFMRKNPRHPYILRWDAPKVEGLRTLYPHFYKNTFTTG